MFTTENEVLCNIYEVEAVGVVLVHVQKHQVIQTTSSFLLPPDEAILSRAHDRLTTSSGCDDQQNVKLCQQK